MDGENEEDIRMDDTHVTHIVQQIEHVIETNRQRACGIRD